MIKIFRLTNLKYLSVLLISMVVFILSFLIEYYYDIPPLAEAAMYGVGFLTALAWGILNYVCRLNLGMIYKKYNDINIFVNATNMNKDEKAELYQYLNDFAKDLEGRGESRDNAVKKAISHFQVQEFLEASGGMFEKQNHLYMIGYILVFVGAALVTGVLYYLLTIPVLVLMAFTCILYSIGFIALFFLYIFIDVLMTKI